MAFGMNNGLIIETDDEEDENQSIEDEFKSSSIHSDIELGGIR